MKNRLARKISLGLLAASPLVIQAEINIEGTTGEDGDLNPAANVTVDLAAALPAAWTNAPAEPGFGVYDSNKWAVVFKYGSVTIDENTEVRFKNNATRAPVVWLVSSNVTINGVLNLNGQNAGTRTYSEPGPGGFRGGKGDHPPFEASAGFGPGGGHSGDRQNGASHASTYGQATIWQLIGGSGGGGLISTGNDVESNSGGGGGGAILIAAKGKIIINGRIMANGGNGLSSGSGSGGAIRLIAEEIGGNGRIEALGGTDPRVVGNRGDFGFIRLEALSVSLDNDPLPPTQVAVLSDPVRLWPSDGSPSVDIIAISGNPVRTDPKAALAPQIPDVNVPAPGVALVEIETKNLPTNSIVMVFVTPMHGKRSQHIAEHVLGDEALSKWRAQLDAKAGYCALQVRAAVAP
ncbi:MAG: hypothetical protein L0Z50_04870 [Verrucomicrobiales bacterium]|nr:hypothetical protein [Verrucomicrobiales bacterium]